MLAVWPALGVAVAGIVGGLAVAVTRALRAWRTLKRTKATIGARVGDVTTSAGEIEAHLARAEESSQRLAEALAALQRSRARLDVQLSALREARDLLGRAVPFLGGR